MTRHSRIAVRQNEVESLRLALGTQPGVVKVSWYRRTHRVMLVSFQPIVTGAAPLEVEAIGCDYFHGRLEAACPQLEIVDLDAPARFELRSIDSNWVVRATRIRLAQPARRRR